MEVLLQENERLAGGGAISNMMYANGISGIAINANTNNTNFAESFKISNIHVNKSVSITETLKSLQLSNSSNRTQNILGQLPHHQTANQLQPFRGFGSLPQKSSMSSQHSKASHKQMITDLNFLMSQNIELTNACQQMHDEITYVKLREKKIMYFMFILQSKGYPINQIFEQDVKNIPTMRFQEFLDNNPDLEEQMHTDICDDDKTLFSFRTEDSYELLC